MKSTSLRPLLKRPELDNVAIFYHYYMLETVHHLSSILTDCCKSKISCCQCSNYSLYCCNVDNKVLCIWSKILGYSRSFSFRLLSQIFKLPGYVHLAWWCQRFYIQSQIFGFHCKQSYLVLRASTRQDCSQKFANGASGPKRVPEKFPVTILRKDDQEWGL